MGTLEVKIKTLTPLWTGGVDGTMDRIHETGILGSLRWWYEAIVRGLGGSACEGGPEGKKCELTGEKLRKFEKARREGKDWWTALDEVGICDVCKVFGTTGWKRRFRLEVADALMQSIRIDKKVALQERQYVDKNGKEKTPTWYFPNSPRSGELTVCIEDFHPAFNPQIIAGLIWFLSNWTVLGARAQLGFGIVQTTENINIKPLCEQLKNISGNNVYYHLPSLRNIFLAKIHPRNGKSFKDKDSFILKYDLRRLFANYKAIRHFIMGTIKNQKLASKVKISRPYNGEIRVWGWIPEKSDVYDKTWDREKILRAIYQHLTSHYNLVVWREMNSSRDTVSPNLSNAKIFLKSLLNCGE
ncbi:CRISPR-associated RAMP protein, Cmr1 family [Thermodesulfatator indicus DSM 15286]|uniref:CRISPR-associated RAMP protein, Cmr1 family n=1 Tax=Thermodesulfatator indicus (strain DSM 15286 / JCM 11887 / CIR29812) TaxID=667014 RepID=F8A9G1_THEID|nr:type III-B CRISPR module RAMP protein Cmr1 [Thermodesulfatator indicus]AEH44102.1 CRISPR-associated RAMP protein, Cmr1 family [Thermodesulfatator indicus DSM 15286]